MEKLNKTTICSSQCMGPISNYVQSNRPMNTMIDIVKHRHRQALAIWICSGWTILINLRLCWLLPSHFQSFFKFLRVFLCTSDLNSSILRQCKNVSFSGFVTCALTNFHLFFFFNFIIDVVDFCPLGDIHICYPLFPSNS